MGRKIEDVRSRFFYPSIPKPVLTAETPNGEADVDSGQIKINPAFIKMLNEHGVPEEESLDEVLSHEYTHVTRFPGNAGRRMHQYLVTRTILNSQDLAQNAVYAFNEAQTNLFVGVDMGNEATPKVQRVLARGSRGLNKILDGLYQEAFEEDLGVKLNRKDKKLVEQLKELSFTNQRSEDFNLRHFAELVKSHLKQFKPRSGSGFLGMFTQEQIGEGLAQLAQECADKGYSPDQYEQVINELSPDEPITPGKGKLRESRNIYLPLARNYAVPIVRRNIIGNGSLRPEEHKPFSTETSFEDLDPFRSKGILPGITQAWVRKEGETMEQKGIPDSIEVIDNSPSMPNPNESISIPVLGGNVIARAYLLNDRDVTVYSFGSSDYVYGPSRDEEEIGRVLRLHSRKGGTTFNPAKLEALLKDRKRSFDLSVISDMEIKNLADFINSIRGIPELHRVHLFYTNPTKIGYVTNVQKATKGMPNIGYAQLYSRGDIEKITLGELKKSLK